MPRTGRRIPPPDVPGIYLSQWWQRGLIADLDELTDFWETNRSDAIKRAVEFAHAKSIGDGMRSRTITGRKRPKK